MIVLKRDRKVDGTGTYVLYVLSACLEFKRASLQGREVLAAIVPDEHPQAREIARRLKFDGKFEIAHGIEDDAIEGLIDGAPPAAAGPSDLEATALLNGWSAADLAGAGTDGLPGPDGGLSTYAGLTLAQLTLCCPPQGWAEARGRLYPWEIEGWKSPGSSFRAPNLRALGSDAEPEKPDAEPEKLDAEPEKPEPEKPEPEKLDAEPEKPGAEPEPAEEDVVIGWAPAVLEQALIVLAEMRDADPAKAIPSIHKAGYRLRQIEGIDSVPTETYAQLVKLL